MEKYTGICGSFPRPQELRKAINAFNEGKITQQDLERIYRSSLLKVVRLQEEAGLNLLTSGLLLWDDLLRPFAEKLEGIKLGRLLRFFDNNFYYRRPIIIDTIKWREPITLSEIKLLSQATKQHIKAIIPGPYTFIKLSENRFYESEDELAEDLLNALREEVNHLHKFVNLIQIDEPSLVDPELGEADKKWGIEIINELLSKVNMPKDKMLVATYFNLDLKSYSMLLDVKAGLHLDLLSNREAEEALRKFGFEGETLSLGIVNARSIFLENPKQIASNLEKVLASISPKTLIISTNTWLDYIPFEDAVEKLKILGEVLRNMEEL